MYFNYQDDFVTPGISPLLANSLKQILHNPKSLIKPLLLPHLKHLRINREENFGFLFAFAICEAFAMIMYNYLVSLIGNPINLNNSIPRSISLAFVETVTCSPKIVFSFSVKISGKLMCSRKPIFKLPPLSTALWLIPLKSRDFGSDK